MTDDGYCPECYRAVDDKDARCPFCGAPPQMKRTTPEMAEFIRQHYQEFTGKVPPAIWQGVYAALGNDLPRLMRMYELMHWDVYPRTLIGVTPEPGSVAMPQRTLPKHGVARGRQ